MKVIEFLEKALIETGSNTDFVAQIQKMYSTELNAEITNLLSNIEEAIFFDEDTFVKLLSKQEILDASEDLAVDFVAEGIIPLIDMGENDYISYSIQNKIWCFFNIVDEIAFGKKETVFALFS